MDRKKEIDNKLNEKIKLVFKIFFLNLGYFRIRKVKEEEVKRKRKEFEDEKLKKLK
jgi:hypothetical protein